MPNQPLTNGQVSYWYREIGLPTYRQELPGTLEADVAIVGAGFTGLWTAYYLKKAQPDLRVVIIERQFAGFGASGRNGGWLSAQLAGSRRRYAETHGRQGVVDLLTAMRSAVDEVISVADAEGVQADIVKDGLINVARNAAQAERLTAHVAEERTWGLKPSDLKLLTVDELRERIHIHGARLASYSPHCARVQPAKLVQGIAAAVERSGINIYERTTALEIRPGEVRTSHGTVRAPIVLRCLEGFTASIKGEQRNWLPMNSSIIITEPLGEGARSDVGWAGAELLGDAAHGYIYAQRTADHRIALGGRGIPYRYASKTDRYGETQDWTVRSLASTLRSMFPTLRDIDISHAWCGVLGVPRDWCATVNFDEATGLGTAGGYVGSGLTTTNLAGRTLADLVLKRDSDLVRLPWVGRQVRQWEHEPLRWLGVQAMYALYRGADRRESDRSSARTSRLARLANALNGRH